ncbi:TspO/MBR family protein [Pelagibacterium montanilacus]|uniref:TspO/MBR family protein n=1 Tax=Pelagibacterium montanilacus TaxID=2185280 RepID=UPI001FE67621|nr:TspO/MBR family protein [Pelagibacterium montanilacus]
MTIEQMKSPKSLITLAAFVLVVIGVGAAIGTQTAPGTWYANLDKPPFNPPNWIFGPVWFALYALIAIAGWRTAMLAPISTAMVLWVSQMLLNWAWSPMFFQAQMLWGALAIIIPMLGAIIGFIVVSWPRDRIASLCFVPSAAWVGFATVLNISLVALN